MGSNSEEKDQRKIGANDIKLLVMILAIGIACMLALHFFKGDTGQTVRITANGTEYIYDIDNDREIDVETDLGTNIVVIEGGSVYVREADCPDRICVHHVRINRTGETIVCLPHRLVVEII
ncbi:MAG: NusG domain II-containing protein [Lachnospiraceae bacterium]|nr:NusG domain II-containing protein [Lachnospiraceae bacterium]